MNELRSPIMYLERKDFTLDGNLIPELRKSPVFVMIQSKSCGHCNNAKPAFQALANEGIVRVMTIQADGQRQSERDLNSILDYIYPGDPRNPGFPGFPSYMLFMPNGQKIPYIGSRDLASMRNFILSRRM